MNTAEFTRGIFLRDSLLFRSFLCSLAVFHLLLATSFSTIAASPSAVFLAISSFLWHNFSSLWFYFCYLSSKCNAFCTASFCFFLFLSFSDCTHSVLVRNFALPVFHGISLYTGRLNKFDKGEQFLEGS